jgi:hypothetical protein
MSECEVKWLLGDVGQMLTMGSMFQGYLIDILTGKVGGKGQLG